MEELNSADLQGLFVFQLLHPDELEELVPIFTKKIYLPDMTVFSEGSKGESMYIIKSGAVKVVKNAEEIIQLAGGDFFGEVALFDYAVRTASIIATENTILLEINRQDFNKLFTKSAHIVAKILYQMMTEMSRRLRRKNNPGGGLVF
ncbi:MAG: cyclic nucleotide-binding domain-containing protein [Candidatus Omnitrophica bacterium]|nr:cyclic nucleotide-binding domain-containing protein [Candidatus Omnitrophota bacterium]